MNKINWKLVTKVGGVLLTAASSVYTAVQDRKKSEQLQRVEKLLTEFEKDKGAH